MSVTATVLFDTPQCEVASLLRQKLARSVHTQIVAGFATVEGMAAIEKPISKNPASIDTFIVGAGTYRAFEAFDKLLSVGVPSDRLHVHLGHCRSTGSSARYRFYRYHPMLHSKVYYLEHGDGTATALIGSHNVTGFALLGLNGEAAVMLEGDQSSPEFAKVRNHIASARAEAVEYNPAMKTAFAWWTHQFMEGLADKANDIPREGEGKKTIVILCTCEGNLPRKGNRIYFELPAALGKIQSMKAEVHIYVFDSLPRTPSEGLARLATARESYWCRTIGLEEARGGVELRADFYLDDLSRPNLRPTPTPFRPAAMTDKQQVRVEVRGNVHGSFEYLFGPRGTRWVPDLDQNSAVRVSQDDVGLFESLDLIPQEHQPWSLVRNLLPEEATTDDKYLSALEQMSPESGAYLMMSPRRRVLEANVGDEENVAE